MDADNPKIPNAQDMSNLTQLAAAVERLKQEKMEAIRAIDNTSDAEIDRILREAGGDPEAIGRRGAELVARILAERQTESS